MGGGHDKSAPQRQKLSGGGKGSFTTICGPVRWTWGQGGGRQGNSLSGRRQRWGSGCCIKTSPSISFQLDLKLIQRKRVHRQGLRTTPGGATDIVVDGMASPAAMQHGGPGKEAEAGD